MPSMDGMGSSFSEVDEKSELVITSSPISHSLRPGRTKTCCNKNISQNVNENHFEKKTVFHWSSQFHPKKSHSPRVLNP